MNELSLTPASSRTLQVKGSDDFSAPTGPGRRCKDMEAELTIRFPDGLTDAEMVRCMNETWVVLANDDFIRTKIPICNKHALRRPRRASILSH